MQPLVDRLIAALALPDSCCIDQRVPKKLLIESGALTAADKRQINDGIEEVRWVAALKSNTIGVVEYRDKHCEYVEIAVLVVALRKIDGKPPRTDRITELIHRAVPYPVMLILSLGQHVELSLAHKRWAQNDAGKVVLDGDVIAGRIQAPVSDDSIVHAFLQSLALVRLQQTTLRHLYQSWIDATQALLAGIVTGEYKASENFEQAAARREALQEYQRLEAKVARLRVQATKVSQIADKVNLNLQIKQVEKKMTAVREEL